MSATDQSRLLGALRLIAVVFDELGVDWALVGGLAVSVRAEPRFTRDVDLAVAVNSDSDAEQLIHALMARGFHVVLSLEQNALGRLATVRLLPPGETAEGIVVDLLFASSGIEREICLEAEAIEVAPHLRVPVAQVGHLLALKVLADAPDRPQDKIDLAALARELSAADRQRAIQALRRIQDLGANRGKSLLADANRWLGSDC